MSEAIEGSPDDVGGVADAIERAAHGATVHLVRDGRRVADIVPSATAVNDVDLAAREARMADRDPRDVEAGLEHAARFGAPSLQHYRDVYAAVGRSWPGEAFAWRYYPVADAS